MKKIPSGLAATTARKRNRQKTNSTTEITMPSIPITFPLPVLLTDRKNFFARFASAIANIPKTIETVGVRQKEKAEKISESRPKVNALLPGYFPLL